MHGLDEEFTQRSLRHLREEYLPRIARACAELPEADLWWRPHDRANSVGNLLLHLDGNVRQWILHGLGGERNERDRDAEFRAHEGAALTEILGALRQTVLGACAVIEGLDGEDLMARVRIQGFDTTALGAVLHVVEHFAWHTGQIVWIAKERAGASHGIAFYDDRKLQRP